MPSKSSKKSKAAKKSAGKQASSLAPPKYTVSSPSRCVTRAASAAAGAGVIPDDSPGVAPSSFRDPLQVLEEKFDTRMAQMETTIRSALMASTAPTLPVIAQPVQVPAATPTAAPLVQTASVASVSSEVAPPTDVPQAVGGHSSRSSGKDHRSRHRHSSSPRSSSSSSHSSSSD